MGAARRAACRRAAVAPVSGRTNPPASSRALAQGPVPANARMAAVAATLYPDLHSSVPAESGRISRRASSCARRGSVPASARRTLGVAIRRTAGLSSAAALASGRIKALASSCARVEPAPAIACPMIGVVIRGQVFRSCAAQRVSGRIKRAVPLSAAVTVHVSESACQAAGAAATKPAYPRSALPLASGNRRVAARSYARGTARVRENVPPTRGAATR
jgi:hypothetical protein